MTCIKKRISTHPLGKGLVRVRILGMRERDFGMKRGAFGIRMERRRVKRSRFGHLIPVFRAFLFTFYQQHLTVSKMAFIELWNRWSDGRKDTRTQPTGTFEHFYDGDGRKIGYILSDPVGDHTLALYSAWSDSRKDSRLQVSAERLPEYGSNIELVGYIYKPPRNGESPRFGTVPLYRAYNSHRQDSRTQVEPGFEPGYENREVLGYIPSHEIVLEKINFDQLDLDS